MAPVLPLVQELRTPLSVVAGFLELAKDESDPDLLRRFVAIAERNAQLLTAAIAAVEAELLAGR
jgi:signal transduction histidine kinase